MIGLVRSEIRKVLSTKFWWVLLLIAFGYVAMTEALLAFTFSLTDSFDTGTGETLPLPEGSDLALMIYSTGSSFGYVFAAILGAMLVSTEFRFQTVTWTFLAEPHRGRVLGAKLIAVLPFAMLIGLGLVFAGGLGGGTLALTGKDPGFGEWAIWEYFLRCLLSITIWGLVGVGLGTLVKNQIAAIIGLLGFTQFLEPILRMLPLFTGQQYAFLNYLPGSVGDAISGNGLYNVLAASTGESLSLGLALVVLLGYAALFTIVGYFTTIRRDVS